MPDDLCFLLDHSVWNSLIDKSIYHLHESETSRNLIRALTIQLSEGEDKQMVVITPELLELIKSKTKNTFALWNLEKATLLSNPKIIEDESVFKPHIRSYLESLIHQSLFKNSENFYFVTSDEILMDLFNDISKKINCNFKIISPGDAYKLLISKEYI
jgi:hypothetical protein